MATVQMVSWNIQVYGPKKYSNQNANNLNVARFVAQALASLGANMIVLQEVMSSVAGQIGFTIASEVAARMGNVAWNYTTMPARPGGDRESYVFVWRDTNDAPADFRPVMTGAGVPAEGLPANAFPSKWTATGGRRAGYKTFRTNDTNVNFVVTDYHAPANFFAGIGPESVAKMVELYTVTNMGAAQAVTGRLLGGDYNLDINTPPAPNQGYPWFTNPVPAVPPPAAFGQGAGSQPITAQNTRFGSYDNAEKAWGPDPSKWPSEQSNYVHNGQAYDNIFYAHAGGVVNGRAMQLLGPMATDGHPLNVVARQFDVTNNAFPYSAFFPPLKVALRSPGYAFLLYRYAISDHIPVTINLVV